MLARKALFAWLAASADSLASVSAASARRSGVMSVKVAISPSPSS